MSERTVRVTMPALDGGGVPLAFPDEPAMVARQWKAPVLAIRSQVPSTSAKAGELTVELSTVAGVEYG